MGTLLGPFWLKWVHNLCGPQVGGLRMEPVVTQEDSVGDLTEVFFLLVLSWVVTGFAGFLLGWYCTRGAHSKIRPGSNLRDPVPGGWHRLVSKALVFIGRRRRIALAFNHLGNSSLRNGENSRPNLARRQHRARQHTPGRILNEGPAIDRNGPDRRRARHD